MSTFSENLRALRTQQALSQQDLAGALCVTQQAVGKWENGTSIPQFDRITDLSVTLASPIPSLLFDNNTLTPSIPIDITEDTRSYISHLEKKAQTSGLTYPEKIEMDLLKKRLQASENGKHIIRVLCTEYEHNLLSAIRYIHPEYPIRAFMEILQAASLMKCRQALRHNQ